MSLRKLLTSFRHTMRIGRGGFGALRRFIAFFISSKTVVAFGMCRLTLRFVDECKIGSRPSGTAKHLNWVATELTEQ